MQELTHKYLLRMMAQLHYTISVVYMQAWEVKQTSVPVIRTRIISPSINGDGNLVLTGVMLDLNTYKRNMDTESFCDFEIWKAKKI